MLLSAKFLLLPQCLLLVNLHLALAFAISEVEHQRYLNSLPVRVFALPEQTDVLNKNELPPLVFPGQKDVGLISGQNKNLEDIRNQIKDLKLRTQVADGTGSLLGMIPKAGSTIKLTVSTLAKYLMSVEKLAELQTDVKIQLGIDKALVANSLSLLKAEIISLISRFNEMLDPTTENSEKKLSVVPAIHSAQKIAALFGDRSYVMWKFKSIFAPYLFTFISLYTTVAKLSVDLLPSKRSSLADEMGLLLHTLNAYEPEVLSHLIKHIVVFNNNNPYYENFLSKKFCPKIKIFSTSTNYREWETRIAQWKSPIYYPEKSGCVLGDANSPYKFRESDVYYVLPKVFKNEISGDLLCGWENCFENLKQNCRERVRTLFDESRSLFPDFTNRNRNIRRPQIVNGDNVGPVCRRDSFGRLYAPGNGDLGIFGGDANGYGCHNSKCWAYCDYRLVNSWCYTGHSRNKITRCTKKEDCCPEWECAGRCMPF